VATQTVPLSLLAKHRGTLTLNFVLAIASIDLIDPVIVDGS
jgi:hypothetical protein